jgi:hypothetical protein
MAIRAADWPLLTGDCYSEVAVSTGLTVFEFFFQTFFKLGKNCSFQVEVSNATSENYCWPNYLDFNRIVDKVVFMGNISEQTLELLSISSVETLRANPNMVYINHLVRRNYCAM